MSTETLHASPTLTVEWVPASVWGRSEAAESFLSQRPTYSRTHRTEAIVHHTAGADADDTPNTWARPDAYAYMRRLETLRPDLGPLPYNFNVAALEDGRTVLVLEGRGLDRSGAHTKNHNRTGLAAGILGNLDKSKATDPTTVRLVAALSIMFAHARHQLGFVNLGTVTPADGREAFGHRDFKSTSCPGSAIWATLPGVAFVEPPRTEETMETTAARLAVSGVWATMLGSWVTGTGNETAQQRLTRIARQIETGKDGDGNPYTLDDLRASLEPFVPSDIAARRKAFFTSKAVPAWVIVPGVVASFDGTVSPASSGPALKPGDKLAATLTITEV